MSKILFEYKSIPAWGPLPHVPTRYVTIFDDGRVHVMYNEYNSDLIIPNCVFKSINEPQIAVSVKTLLSGRNTVIKNLPKHLDNGSCDGSVDFFRFEDTELSSLNIEKHDLDEVRKRNPSYYERYQMNMQCENILCDLYDEIVSIIRKFAPELTFPLL